MSSIKYCAAMILLLQTPFVSSQTSCSLPSAFVFINGITNSFKEASLSLISLNDRLSKSGILGDTTLLYNPSEGLFNDLTELKTQVAFERSIRESEASVIVDMAALGYPTDLTATQMATIQTKLALAYANSVAKLDYSFTYNNQIKTTASLVADFVSKISGMLANSKVILIPHSQGNMFANESYLSIKAQLDPTLSSQLSVASIATPANFAPSNLYLTLIEDDVINKWPIIPLIGPGATPLKPNISAAQAYYQPNSNFGHAFEFVYLNETLQGIQNGVTNFMSQWVTGLISQAITVATPYECRPVAPVCPLKFTQTQISQIKPGETVAQVNGILGCEHDPNYMNNWYQWGNPNSLLSLTGNVVQVKFTNGVYLGTLPDVLRVTGPTYP